MCWQKIWAKQLSNISDVNWDARSGVAVWRYQVKLEMCMHPMSISRQVEVGEEAWARVVLTIRVLYVTMKP